MSQLPARPSINVVWIGQPYTAVRDFISDCLGLTLVYWQFPSSQVTFISKILQAADFCFSNLGGVPTCKAVSLELFLWTCRLKEFTRRKHTKKPTDEPNIYRAVVFGSLSYNFNTQNQLLVVRLASVQAVLKSSLPVTEEGSANHTRPYNSGG